MVSEFEKLLYLALNANEFFDIIKMKLYMKEILYKQQLKKLILVVPLMRQVQNTLHYLEYQSRACLAMIEVPAEAEA